MLDKSLDSKKKTKKNVKYEKWIVNGTFGVSLQESCTEISRFEIPLFTGNHPHDIITEISKNTAVIGRGTRRITVIIFTQAKLEIQK